MKSFKFLVVFLLCLFLFGCSYTPIKQPKQAVLTKYESVVPQGVKDLDIYKKPIVTDFLSDIG